MCFISNEFIDFSESILIFKKFCDVYENISFDEKITRKILVYDVESCYKKIFKICSYIIFSKFSKELDSQKSINSFEI